MAIDYEIKKQAKLALTKKTFIITTNLKLQSFIIKAGLI